jgi:hypothetical protein
MKTRTSRPLFFPQELILGGHQVFSELLSAQAAERSAK